MAGATSGALPADDLAGGDLSGGAASGGTPASPGTSVHVPILMYHYIRVNPRPSDVEGGLLSVPPDLFAAQMALLRADGCHAVSLAQVLAALEGGDALPSHPVVLTFDDGYADFATTAVPILRHFGFVGTDFVVTGFLGRHRYMTADQVRDVAAAGMIIGAHTVTHPDLSTLSAAAAQVEIAASKTALEALLGHPVVDFAYPAGKFTAGVLSQVEQAGFRDAVTTRPGIGVTLGGRYVLPRVRIGPGRDLRPFAADLGLPYPADWAAGVPATLQPELADLVATVTGADVAPAVAGRRTDPW